MWKSDELYERLVALWTLPLAQWTLADVGLVLLLLVSVVGLAAVIFYWGIHLYVAVLNWRNR